MDRGKFPHAASNMWWNCSISARWWTVWWRHKLKTRQLRLWLEWNICEFILNYTRIYRYEKHKHVTDRVNLNLTARRRAKMVSVEPKPINTREYSVRKLPYEKLVLDSSSFRMPFTGIIPNTWAVHNMGPTALWNEFATEILLFTVITERNN